MKRRGKGTGIIIITLLLNLATFTAKSQNSAGFSAYGKPVFLVFSNLHTSFNDNGNNTAFEITRLYLGYEHFFSESFSARANIDVGDPGIGDLHMTAYVKNAFLQYKKSGFSGRIGMISTDQFSLIEKHWGYRYIFKTFADEYGLGPSADLGFAAEYSPAKFISVDASVLNGEGYKKLQSDSTLKYTTGITLKPVAGLVLRGYTDFMKKDNVQKTISLFAGYSVKSFKAGFEYTNQKNNRMMRDHDLSGISGFGSAGFAKKFTVFFRYDNLWSSKIPTSTESWNYNRDGQLFLGGADYSPVAGVRIAPVFYTWKPANRSMPVTSTAGFYFEYKF